MAKYRVVEYIEKGVFGIEKEEEVNKGVYTAVACFTTLESADKYMEGIMLSSCIEKKVIKEYQF